MTGYASLEEALTFGYGIERSFLCPAHEDHHASASVNSLNGLWTCYACHASGKADLSTLEYDIKALQKTMAHLEQVLTPNRRYAESYLARYDSLGPGAYWLSRYSQAACRHFRLGQSIDGKYATIPIRDTDGALLGVVRRVLDGSLPKYQYPPWLKMTEQIFNLNAVRSSWLVLVEGATDVVAAYETGFDVAVAMYGSSCSYAQRDLIRKYYPRRILVAFDQDQAGESGYERVNRLLGPDFEVQRLVWTGAKDLSEIPLPMRTTMFRELARQTIAGY